MAPFTLYTDSGTLSDNFLFYGDNLDVLRRHVKDESADLVYLDPPFNSARSYNVLFEEHDGTKAAAQIAAFEEPSEKMRADAASSGFYTSPWGKHQKVQLLTIEELLNGKGIDYPKTSGTNKTFKAAPKVKEKKHAGQLMLGEEPGDDE